MSPVELLARLKDLGVELSAEGGRLRYDAPVGVLTPALRAELTRHKSEILSFLSESRSAEELALPPIEPVARDSELPLSFAQQRLWFLAQLNPHSTEYNIVRCFHILGALDVGALERSLNEIVRRHESLRTTFHLGVDGPVQRIFSELRIDLDRCSLQHVPESGRRDTVTRLATEECSRLFDLRRGPLLRLRLLHVGNTEHALILAMHHIVSDGWSIGVLMRELSSLYNAFRAGRSSRLAEPPVQYADYTHWQQTPRSRQVLDTQLAYWKRQLQDLRAFELPTDHSRPAVQTGRGAHEKLTLSPELTRAVRRLAQREGVTRFTTLLAAFAVLLQRYSSQDDIAMGCPMANRNRAELEGLIGFFANTLVLRVNLDGNPNFRELLARARSVVLEAQQNQDLPFERLVQELQPERDLSRNPLFQVMFAFQAQGGIELTLEGTAVETIPVNNDTSKFDLLLDLREGASTIEGSIEYSTDLFGRPTIRRMVSHYLTLLAGLVASPERPVSDLPMLTESEHQQLVVEWNRTTLNYPRERTIHELFETQVSRTPRSVALVHERARLSYHELNERANRLAHHLRDRGVGPEVRVGVCIDRSPHLVVALLGILKAGGAYVPLDPEYPPQRMTFMLEDSSASVLITVREFLSRMQAFDGEVVCLDSDWSRIQQEDTTNPGSGVTARNLAYVIYTSGSTGTPKGVCIEHRNAVALLSWAPTVFGPEELAGVLASTSISFDLSVFEIFLPLSTGGKVILAEHALRLLGLGASAEVTLVNTVPSIMAELLQHGSLPPSVRVVNLAGEPLQSWLVDRLYQHPSIERVYDLYGPSETTTYSTFSLRTPNGPVTIGRPISNTRIYLLDRRMQPVPVGVPGELYIGGAGVARGYLDRSELTAKRFVRDPFGGEPDSRLYKTGDLARYLPDGSIEYLGRLDHQVKLRGLRIELGEIEATLLAHPAAREAVAVCRDDAVGNKRIVAYVVTVEGESSWPSELQGYLVERLPGYMVPSEIVLLKSLPLTPNGKVDRGALSRSEPPQRDATVPITPESAMERRLLGLWQEVLGTDRIGIDDNFFDLGGNSLMLVVVHERLRGLVEQELSIADLFRFPTVRALARYCDQEAQGPPESRDVLIRANRQRQAMRARAGLHRERRTE